MPEIHKNVAVVILAAGKGTRMKSDKAKVLHEINSRPMISYVVACAKEIAGDNVVVLVGHQAEIVRTAVSKIAGNVIFALQKKQLGTGHAVMCAIPHIKKHVNEVVILCGDTPLITLRTIESLLSDHVRAKRDLTVLAAKTDNPFGYGRIVLDERGNVTGIVEEADATQEQKKIKIVNSGIYCVSMPFLSKSLKNIRSENAQSEFYLTDIIEIGYKGKKALGVTIEDCFEEISGVNTMEQLQKIETIMRQRQG